MTKFTEKNGRTYVEIAIPTDKTNEAVLIKASWNTEHLNSVQNGDLKVCVETGMQMWREKNDQGEDWMYRWVINGADKSLGVCGEGGNTDHEFGHDVNAFGGNWREVNCEWEVSIIPTSEATPEQLDYELDTNAEFEVIWS